MDSSNFLSNIDLGRVELAVIADYKTRADKAADARKKIVDWINSSTTPVQRLARKRLMFTALYSADDTLLEAYASMIVSPHPATNQGESDGETSRNGQS